MFICSSQPQCGSDTSTSSVSALHPFFFSFPPSIFISFFYFNILCWMSNNKRGLSAGCVATQISVSLSHHSMPVWRVEAVCVELFFRAELFRRNNIHAEHKLTADWMKELGVPGMVTSEPRWRWCKCLISLSDCHVSNSVKQTARQTGIRSQSFIMRLSNKRVAVAALLECERNK